MSRNRLLALFLSKTTYLCLCTTIKLLEMLFLEVDKVFFGDNTDVVTVLEVPM